MNVFSKFLSSRPIVEHRSKMYPSSVVHCNASCCPDQHCSFAMQFRIYILQVSVVIVYATCRLLAKSGSSDILYIMDWREFWAYACHVSVHRFSSTCVKLTIGLISGCGTASNLWKSSLSSGPMLMYAPLFSVLSQYLGAEKTGHCQLASVARKPEITYR